MRVSRYTNPFAGRGPGISDEAAAHADRQCSEEIEATYTHPLYEGSWTVVMLEDRLVEEDEDLFYCELERGV